MGILKDFTALIKGMQITGKHLGRHAVTIQYPEQRDTIPEISRGMVVLLSDQETGELNCTACMLCERACPTGAIQIDAPRDENKKRQLSAFNLDQTLCCFCGMCEEACNFSAIKMCAKYEFSEFDRTRLEWDIVKLQQMGKDVSYVDTRRRKNPVNKVGRAAETEAANVTVKIEAKKKAEEKKAAAAADRTEGGDEKKAAETKKTEEKKQAAPAADKKDKGASQPDDAGSGASDDKKSNSGTKEEGNA